MFLLKRTLLSSTSPFSKTAIFTLRCLSATPSDAPPPEPHFMESYLITTCGFPPAAAAAVTAKRLSHLQSPAGPNSALCRLKSHGFSAAHIRTLISLYPSLLCAPDAIDPNIRTLLAAGFSGPDLHRVVVRNPRALSITNLAPRIDYWRQLLGGDDKKLRLAFERNRNLIGLDAARSLPPKIALFKKHGLSDDHVRRLVLLGSKVLTSGPDSIEALLNWTFSLGFTSNSPMFIYALHALARNGKAGFERKMNLFKSYGWSEHEFLFAFQRAPTFATLAEKSIQTKMAFLVGKAGCTQTYIVHHPLLLAFSLEKRLLPRNHVVQVLKAKGVAVLDFNYVMGFTDKMFLEKIIPRYTKEVPELLEIYVAACAGKFLFEASG